MPSETEIARKRAEAKPLKGVNYDPRTDKFTAQVMVGGMRNWLGAYDTSAEALAVYNAAKPTPKSERKVKAQTLVSLGPAQTQSTFDGLKLWGSAPFCMRPRFLTESHWVSKVWTPAELRMIGAWQESTVIWEALAHATGKKPEAPKPDQNNYDFWVAQAALDRPWPAPRLPMTQLEVKECMWRRQERVRAWTVHIKAKELAWLGFEGLLASTLPENLEDALAELIFVAETGKPLVPLSERFESALRKPKRPPGLGFIPAERSGLTREQTKQLMDDLGMDHVAFSAHVNAMVKETGVTFGPMVRRIWEGLQTV